MILDFDVNNPVDSFLENLKAYSKDFDIDEHVEMWIPERENGGCPSSIKELVEDAENMGIPIVEHIIAGDPEHYSFYTHGFFDH